MPPDVDGRAAPLGVTLVGAGPGALPWQRGLRGVDGVDIVAIDAESSDALLGALADPSRAAVAIVTPHPDLAGAIKRALVARRHVFVAGPAAIAARQLLTLDALARSRGCVLLFDSEGLGDERLAFVRRMVGGAQALWRPRYVRALRTGADEHHTLDELAIAQIEYVLALLAASPARVSALAPGAGHETGAADAAMVTLVFDSGPVARIDLSTLEPQPRHEVTIACENRTIVLDAYDLRAPLQVQAAQEHRGPQRGAWNEMVSEHPAASAADRTVRAAQAFVSAARARDLNASNTREIAAAAAVWERARASIAAGGDFVAIAPTDDGAARPTLRVIQGGGKSTPSAAPELTLVHPPHAAPESA
jgi:predicted dehydrogenase